MKTGDRFQDRDGRKFTLVTRTDPRGTIPPYWSVHHDDGVDTTVRENRLESDDYSPISDESASHEL